MPDILFILVLALVIFGPKKLPELLAHAGKYIAQFRRMKRELTGLMESEMTKIATKESDHGAERLVRRQDQSSKIVC